MRSRLPVRLIARGFIAARSQLPFTVTARAPHARGFTFGAVTLYVTVVAQLIPYLIWVALLCSGLPARATVPFYALHLLDERLRGF